MSDPVAKFYSPNSPNRDGRPLGATVVGQRFAAVVVCITLADLEHKICREWIAVLKSRMVSDGASLKIEVY